MPDTEISQETSRENCKGDIQIQRDHNDGSENKSKIFEDVERAAILGWHQHADGAARKWEESR